MADQGDDLDKRFLRGVQDKKDEINEAADTTQEDAIEKDPVWRTLKTVWRERSAEAKTMNHETMLDHVWQSGHQAPSSKKDFYRRGKRLFLWSWASAMAAGLTGIVVVVMMYLSGTSEPAPTDRDAFIYKENPASQQTRFMLPDGSVVWLNSKSSLRYARDFTPRTVTLNGEAFFQVKENPQRPFTVTAGNLSTTVLGTSFNVAAYPEVDAIEVALVTGKVSVHETNTGEALGVLAPGMGMCYEKRDAKVTCQPFDSRFVLAWKDGILAFEGDSFSEFTRKLSQWYGVDIQVEGHVPNHWQIRGRFDHESLSSVLHAVSFNKQFTYSLHEKMLTLKF